MRRLTLFLTHLVCVPVFISTGCGQTTDNSEPPTPTTPIRHLVVIFPENVSFDHYFATYPHAETPPGEPKFVSAPDTPMVNGLSSVLLTHNANASNPANGSGAVNPFRLNRSQAAT